MSYTGDDVGGVGGWLAFFVIIMAALTPLRLVFGTAADLYGDAEIAIFYGSAWLPLQISMWATVVAALGICWFITYRLMRVERWSTVRLTIAGIWLLVIGVNLGQLVLISILASIPLGELISAGGFEIVRGIIFGAIWTSYFLLSKRVANTFRRDPEGEELAERFA